jgi:SAM-dependent methyltransferase
MQEQEHESPLNSRRLLPETARFRNCYCEDFVGLLARAAKNFRCDSRETSPTLQRGGIGRLPPPARPGFPQPLAAPDDPVNNVSQPVHTRYRDTDVASKYDQRRYADLQGRMNNRAAWRALRRALRHVQPAGRLLDIPSGTGRFSRQLAEAGFAVFASDISMEMLAMMPGAGAVRRFQGDVFHLPFPDRTFAAAVCIRFFNLVDRSMRFDAVRELARVADVVIAGYYHRYTLKYAGRWLRNRLGLHQGNNPRLSSAGLRDELRQTGLRLLQIVPVAPLLSEEWLVVLSGNNPRAF